MIYILSIPFLTITYNKCNNPSMEMQTQPGEPITNPVAPHRNFLLLGALVIIAALLGSGVTYLALQSKTQQPQPTPVAQTQPSPTPTPDPTANWQTYANTQYGFSIKYPSSWKPYEYKPGDQYLFDLGIIPNINDIMTRSPHSNPRWGLTITIFTSTFSEESLKQSRSDKPSSGDTIYFSGYTSQPITFFGVPANKSYKIFSDVIPDYDTNIALNNGKHGWVFGYPNTDFQGNHENIYDQILSTFKFTP